MCHGITLGHFEWDELTRLAAFNEGRLERTHRGIVTSPRERSNEFLRSYTRDVGAAKSVRPEEKGGRKRQRELERERKEAEKKERREGKVRLKKLKLDEAQEKLRKIKRTAGSAGKDLTDEDWIKFLDDAWEDDKWEEEMTKRFGDDYYAQKNDAIASDEEGEDGEKKSKRPKKPKWDDDIDIKDLIPDFRTMKRSQRSA
ncbi:hypothetical protein FOVSG1_006660 [Fusarium oxysporum f. sp. vasinfectum]